MRQQIGVLLQVLVLMYLPLLVGFNLWFKMPLILMPALTMVAIGLFSLGQRLRTK